MSNRRVQWLVSALLCSAALAGPVHADQVDEVRSLKNTTIALVNLLVQHGVLTREKADELIRQAEQAGTDSAKNSTPPAVPATPVAPGVVRVPYIPESVKQQIREEVKKDVLAQAKQERWGEPGALPGWLDRFTFSGDIRVRGQHDRFPTDNTPNAIPQQLQIPEFGGYTINNTSEPRNRLRLRVRFGTDINVADTVNAAFRLTSVPR